VIVWLWDAPGPARTTRGVTGSQTRARQAAEALITGRYAQVVYLTSPAARHVVAGTAGNLPPAQAGRVAVRDLPDSAFAPGA
jgi:hypothetical protein